jgi:hypothetical protein
MVRLAVLSAIAGVASWAAGGDNVVCGHGATPGATDRLEAALWSTLPERHKALILRNQTSLDECGRPRRAMCFAPDTPNHVIEAFEQYVTPFDPPQEFNTTTRWGPTALDPGSAGNQGDPTTITWSIVPDGLNLEDDPMAPVQPSTLRAWLDGLYGSSATWQPLIQSVFDRWGALSGLNFVYESNDDGAAFVVTPGAAGVRGDVRIGGFDIDGNSGILAYNYYPAFGGDMVINSFDSFYNTTTNNSLRFRNVVAHEHGHGMGLPHVCPPNTTKLMEPFATAVYDGPRMDDIRASHRLYGDAFEPNDTAATFTTVTLSGGTATVGAVPAPAVLEGSITSIDDVSDVDYYRFSTPSGNNLVSVRVKALGFTHDDADQACSGYFASCCVGSVSQPQSGCGLSVQVLNSAGNLIIATASPTDVPGELGADFPISGAGNYLVRVGASNCDYAPQLYTATISTSLPAVRLSLTSPDTPAFLTANVPTSFFLQASGGTQNLNASTVKIFYRVGTTGAFSQSTAVFQAGFGYEATLPGQACGSTVQYYFEARSTTNTAVTIPAAGASGPFTSEVGTLTAVFTDTFETNQGWTTGPDTATTGFWVLGDPEGTAAQPDDDATPAGTQCWFTQQGAQGETPGANDVDGGAVILNSPNIDASGTVAPRLLYNLWYSNGAGAGAFNDTFVLEYSTNGGSSWLPATTIGPGNVDTVDVTPAWIERQWKLPAGANTSQFRVRFTVADLGSGSVLEGALDDFRLVHLTCPAGGGCDSLDFNNDGVSPDTQDLTDLLSVFGGGACSTDPTPGCNDIDFNNDGVAPDTADIDAFLLVFGGGTC